MTNRQMHEIILRRQPVTLRPEATVQEACREMRNHRIGAVLVTDAADRLLGIFTGTQRVAFQMLMAKVIPIARRGRLQGYRNLAGGAVAVVDRAQHGHLRTCGEQGSDVRPGGQHLLEVIEDQQERLLA